eukprot:m.333368 g.333368  ORF g.333368 m.333368 type:complete len:57 (-) comp20504_c0_seq14:1380-1550(-)
MYCLEGATCIDIKSHGMYLLNRLNTGICCVFFFVLQCRKEMCALASSHLSVFAASL